MNHTTSTPAKRPGLTLAAIQNNTAQGRLVVAKCGRCSTQQSMPAQSCFNCGSIDLSTSQHSGDGVLFSWVVCHYPFDESWKDQVPYTVVLVDLQGGGRVYGLLGSDGDRASLRMNLAVKLDRDSTRSRNRLVFQIA